MAGAYVGKTEQYVTVKNNHVVLYYLELCGT
jgi:hypothetical protein